MKALFAFIAWTLRHRGLEIALLQGTALIALTTTGTAPLEAHPIRALLALLGSALTVAHVFTLNDWADAEVDAGDPEKTTRFERFGLSTRHVFVGSCVLGAAGLAASALSSPTGVIWGLGVVICGWLYSHPRIYAKGIPVLSSACHALGQIPLFMLGYTAAHALSARPLCLALVFSLTFAAGHLVQETIDRAADKSAGICTNAVRFGPEKALLASFVLFTAAFAQLTLAALLLRAMPLAAAFGALTYPVYALSFFRLVYSKGSKLTPRRLGAHRNVYRAVFAALGGYLLFVNLWRL